jgi:hypothetical protein
VDAYPNTVYLTSDAYARLTSADKEWIGTPDYMGLAYFWAYAYRYPMRDTTASQRKRVHDAFLAAGLEADAESEAHAAIIERIVKAPVAR